MTHPLFEIDLKPAAKGSRLSAQALHQQLKAAVLAGRLALGARLPATRQAGQFFGVSRNTAAEVYERLVNEGYLVARHGSGTFVADPLPAAAAPGRAVVDSAAAPAHRLNTFWLQPEVTRAMGFWQDQEQEQAAAVVLNQAPLVDFRPALVDARLFPFDVFRQVMAKRLRGLERKPASLKSPQGNQGNFHLREAITQHIALTRAVACHSSDVLVTAGAQQAFDVLARTLVIPGETVVAVEDPGYPPMRVAFAAAGARLVPVGVDEEGLMVDAIPPEASVVCLCPSHQFPLGVAMSARRRQALLAWARARRAVVVEDDYDGEFRFDGSPLQALRSAEAADVVFYVGTFSKCMLPSLRLGFIIAPDWALRTLVAAKNALDWHNPVPLQLGVAGFIAEGHLARHVRKMRQVYKQRRQRVLDALEGELSEWLEAIPSFYGMHVAAFARQTGTDLEAVSQALLRHNVKLHTLSRYHLATQPPRPGLVLGYGAVDLPELSRGLTALQKALVK